MKRIYYLVILAATTISVAANAQNTAAYRGVNISAARPAINGGLVDIDLRIDHGKMVIGTNERFTITPFIAKGSDTLKLKPVVFTGSVRNAVISRETKLNDMHKDEAVPYERMVLDRRQIREHIASANSKQGPEEIINYHTSVPYQSWMDGAELKVKQEVYGCTGKTERHYASLDQLAQPVAAIVAFIVPEVEEVKVRVQEMTSHVNFEQDKSVIKREIADNDRELDRIYEFTSAVMENKDAKINSIKIKGYASPEASYSYNDRLSGRRVEALRNNLEQRFGLDRDVFQLDNVPEDWDSLRRWVAGSDIKFRNELLRIIDNTPNPDARDSKIRALDGGRTYNMLLRDVYPELRRVDYAIDYTVIPFTVERGREAIFTEPHNMSLNEMYMVAVSYPEMSDDYVKVFEVMATHYPDDAVTCNNMAAVALSKGDHETARLHLERAKHDPRCKNNMGVVLIKEGKHNEAENYFREAALEGIPEAEFNLTNLGILQ